MKVLITGFETFDGETVNPSWEAVKRLPSRIAEAEILALKIPVAFALLYDTLKRAAEEERPDIFLCVGQAGGASEIEIERVALNLIDARMPDNLGNQPVDVCLQHNGSTAYFAMSRRPSQIYGSSDVVSCR